MGPNLDTKGVAIRGVFKRGPEEFLEPAFERHCGARELRNRPLRRAMPKFETTREGINIQTPGEMGRQEREELRQINLYVFHIQASDNWRMRQS